MKLKALEWKKWKDWERALVYWKELGHDGITPAGLAELTGRKRVTIIKELKKRGTVGGCLCHRINVPVLIVRYQKTYVWPDTVPWIQWDHHKFYTEGYHNSHPDTFWKAEAEATSIVEWPVKPATMKALRMVVAGLKSPWRGKVRGDTT